MNQLYLAASLAGAAPLPGSQTSLPEPIDSTVQRARPRTVTLPEPMILALTSPSLAMVELPGPHPNFTLNTERFQAGRQQSQVQPLRIRQRVFRLIQPRLRSILIRR